MPAWLRDIGPAPHMCFTVCFNGYLGPKLLFSASIQSISLCPASCGMGMGVGDPGFGDPSKAVPPSSILVS